jgi:hypothetical protein
MLLLWRLKRELKKKDLAENGETRRFFAKSACLPSRQAHAMMQRTSLIVGNCQQRTEIS